MEMIASIITYIKLLVSSEQFQRKHKTSRGSFTRGPKMTFLKVILFVICNTKSTLDFEAINFCKYFNMAPVVKSTITKARDKVSYTAFREILNVEAELLPSKKLYKGYQLIAFDGTELELPKTPELMEKYSQKNCNYPRAHAVATYDVLNEKFLDATFLPYPTDERKAAAELVKNYLYNYKTIYLGDRGFPSVALMQQIDNSGAKYVMRVSKSFLKEVNQFAKSKKQEEVIHINYDKKRANAGKVKGVELPYSFDLRCVKIVLASGEVEVLITNLTSEEFSLDEIYELYGLRWEIEVSYNYLKNAIIIEQFMSIKENSIMQEFFATLILYNLSSSMIEGAQKKYDASSSTNNHCKKPKKYDHVINKSKAIAILVGNLLAMFTTQAMNVLVSICDQITLFMSKFVIPIRDDRKPYARKSSSSKFPINYRRNKPFMLQLC